MYKLINPKNCAIIETAAPVAAFMKTRKKSRFGLTAAMLICAIPLSAGRADDWPHWRGPNRNGITSEPSGWDNKSWRPIRTWHKKIGYGSTSPIVVKNRLYAVGWADNKDTVFCLDAATGREIWKKTYNCPPYGRFSKGDKSLYKGTTSTPEYDPKTNLLYTLSIDGDLHCFDADGGEKKWRVNLYDEYKVPVCPGNRDYGYTSSPLALDKWLIVEVGDPDEGCLFALNKHTGKRLWTSRAKDPAGHNGGPTTMTVQGIPCIACFTCAGLLVTRMDKGNEGKTLAAYPWITDFNNNIASAATFGDMVLITSDYDQSKMGLFRINLDGIDAKYEIERDFSKVGTPVIHNKHIYVPYNRLRCYRIDKDGPRLKWKAKSSSLDFGAEGSCLITGDNKMIAFGSGGGKYKLALIDIAGNQPKLLSSNRDVFAGIKRNRYKAWPHVVLAKGRIYCKDREGNIVCFALKR